MPGPKERTDEQRDADLNQIFNNDEDAIAGYKSQVDNGNFQGAMNSLNAVFQQIISDEKQRLETEKSFRKDRRIKKLDDAEAFMKEFTDVDPTVQSGAEKAVVIQATEQAGGGGQEIEGKRLGAHGARVETISGRFEIQAKNALAVKSNMGALAGIGGSRDAKAQCEALSREFNSLVVPSVGYEETMQKKPPQGISYTG